MIDNTNTKLVGWSFKADSIHLEWRRKTGSSHLQNNEVSKECLSMVERWDWDWLHSCATTMVSVKFIHKRQLDMFFNNYIDLWIFHLAILNTISHSRRLVISLIWSNILQKWLSSCAAHQKVIYLTRGNSPAHWRVESSHDQSKSSLLGGRVLQYHIDVHWHDPTIASYCAVWNFGLQSVFHWSTIPSSRNFWRWQFRPAWAFEPVPTIDVVFYNQIPCSQWWADLRNDEMVKRSNWLAIIFNLYSLLSWPLK